MGKRADIEDIKKFKLDMAALAIYYGLSDKEIGEGMNMKKSNFSSYLNGTNPITVDFLKRFYTAWGDKLKAIYENQQASYFEPVSETLTGEEPDYGKKSDKDSHLDTLQKNNDILLKNIGEVIASNSILVETNQKLVAAHLSSGEKPPPHRLRSRAQGIFYVTSPQSGHRPDGRTGQSLDFFCLGLLSVRKPQGKKKPLWLCRGC